MSEIDPALLADLLREAMRKGKLPFLTVVSNSMSPLIRRGDQIQIAPKTAEQLQPGDIIVYKGPANLITHRFWGFLSEKEQTRLVTRGDRPQHFDSPIAPANLVGQVIGRRRKQHFLDLAVGRGKWLNNHLANLARLEIRLFAKPISLSPSSQVQLPKSGGHLSNSPNNLLIRFIRRFLYSWAIILTLIISTISNAFIINTED
jgi:signal peptidase I